MKPALLSPSAILADAAGIPPSGMPASVEGECVMCGTHYDAGAIVTPFAPPDTFMNWSSLTNPTGSHVCGYCAAVTASAYIKAFQCLVASKEGVFRALSNDELASVILDPPAPPFIAHVGSIGKSSHITWRTPVSYSRDVFFIRDGEQVVRINRERVLAGRKVDVALLEKFNTYQALQEKKAALEAGKPGRKGKAKSTKKSCLWLSPRFGNGNNGQVAGDVLAFANAAMEAGDPEPSEMVARLRALAPGDVWAIHRLAYATAPIRGEKIQPSVAA